MDESKKMIQRELSAVRLWDNRKVGLDI